MPVIFQKSTVLESLNIFTVVFFGLFFTFYVFLTKLYGFLDVALFLSFIGALFYFYSSNSLGLDKNVYSMLVFLLFLSVYSGVISLMYGVNELIFYAKFTKTLLLFFFSYFFYLLMSKKINYIDFKRIISFAIVFHALIVIFCIFNSDFRGLVYSFTGFQPRGPEWSRSPGLTISFNSTAIVHIVGLWFLISDKLWPKVLNVVFIIIVLFSLIFLGRSMAFLGLAIIFTLYFLGHYKSYRFFIFSFLTIILVVFVSDRDNISSLNNEVLLSNYDHFVEPVVKFTSSDDSGIGNIQSTLEGHFSFPEETLTLLFGNSMAGHIGLLDQFNSTDSDVGLINSINANGLFVTVSLYFFYLFLIWSSQKSDWQTVFIISSMSVALTFKETGFFTSYATTLLFLVYFYNIKPKPIRDGP